MRLWIGITDNQWFDYLAAIAANEGLEEVNFWRPSGAPFKALSPGELFLFKLHAPRNVIAGGGFFTRVSSLPIRLAWEAFGRNNGVNTEAQMLERIRRYRKQEADLDQQITCIILSEPFFFNHDENIPVPASFSRFNQVGTGYSTEEGEGALLYHEVKERMARTAGVRIAIGPAQSEILESPRYSPPRLVSPRLGQGGFRIGVLEAYRRRCAITGERTVPVLDAAHIRPYSDGGGHELRNGILLRRDLHRLFDLGYLTVQPDDRRIQVSKRIREEFENGREYYALDGRLLALPSEASAAPNPEFLAYHAQHVFRA